MTWVYFFTTESNVFQRGSDHLLYYDETFLSWWEWSLLWWQCFQPQDGSLSGLMDYKNDMAFEVSQHLWEIWIVRRCSFTSKDCFSIHPLEFQSLPESVSNLLWWHWWSIYLSFEQKADFKAPMLSSLCSKACPRVYLVFSAVSLWLSVPLLSIGVQGLGRGEVVQGPGCWMLAGLPFDLS